MDEREQCDRVDDLMQPPPAATARAFAACDQSSVERERSKPKPGREADDQIDAMADLVHDFAEIELLVDDEERQMRGGVAERADAQNAPNIDESAEAYHAAERGHRQRHAEKDERPESGAMNEIVDRPRAVQDRIGFKHRFGERQEQQRERGNAQPR